MLSLRLPVAYVAPFNFATATSAFLTAFAFGAVFGAALVAVSFFTGAAFFAAVAVFLTSAIIRPFYFFCSYLQNLLLLDFERHVYVLRQHRHVILSDVYPPKQPLCDVPSYVLRH